MSKKLSYPSSVSPSFRKRANEAAFWEAWVGTVLARAGLYTLHHPFVADGGDYHALSWDLDVSVDGLNPPIAAGPWIPLECKSLSLTFTCPEDYPYDTVLICSANSWGRKWPSATDTMRDFLFISRETGNILWLPKGAPAKMKKTTDTTRGESYNVMYTDSRNLSPLIDFIDYVKA